MPMNPFSSIAQMIRSPMFRRTAPLAGAVGAGAVVPDAVGDLKEGYDEGIRDETARELLGGIMDAQEQDARSRAEQEALYMQGAQDAVGMMGGGYDDGYLGSPEGMYSMAAAITPSTPAKPVPGPSAAAGVKATGVKAVGPSVLKLSSALAEVPAVLGEVLGIDKESNTAALIGAGVGGGLGAAQGSGSERVRNALLGAVLGGAGGHVLSNPATRASLKGMGSTVVK